MKKFLSKKKKNCKKYHLQDHNSPILIFKAFASTHVPLITYFHLCFSFSIDSSCSWLITFKESSIRDSDYEFIGATFPFFLLGTNKNFSIITARNYYLQKNTFFYYLFSHNKKVDQFQHVLFYFLYFFLKNFSILP